MFDLSWNLPCHGLEIAARYKAKGLFFVKHTAKLFILALLKTFNCSKSTIETLEKVRNMFKVQNKVTKTTSMAYFRTYFTHSLVFLLLTLNS